MPVHRVAHRGYSAVAPENTLPAVAAAILGGATLVEFDVRTTADGVPVVIHDRTVDRTTDGTGHVWDLTADEVRALDAGSWFSPAHAGARVPLLAEVLDLLRPGAGAGPLLSGAVAGPLLSGARAGTLPPGAGAGPLPPGADAGLPPPGAEAGPLRPGAEAGLLLEIKPPASLDEVKNILDMVAERDLLDRTIVQSFDPQIVRLAREVAPGVRRGLLRLRFEADTVPLVRELDVVCCNPSVADVLGDPATMSELAGAGIDVMPWTANDIAQWPDLVEAGVAGLITDRAGELTGWAERHPGP